MVTVNLAGNKLGRGMPSLPRNRTIPAVPVLLICASGLLLAEMALYRLLFISLLYAIAIVLMAPDLLSNLFNKLSKWERKYRINFTAIAFLSLSVLFLLDLSASTAQAQFFGSAEEFMTSNFEGADEVIPLIFNVLRALLLIYLGVSLIRVVQSARNDEDWQTLARTPLIILIAVTVADILTGYIIGG